MPVNARLQIVAILKDGKTILDHIFYSQPFKLLSLHSSESGRVLHLMVLSVSPGVMDGDCYHMVFDIGEGAALYVGTPAYQRIFQMKQGAIQNIEVRLAQGASLIYLPKPVVPQKDSIMEVSSKIFLSGGSSLVWGEVLTCGRKLNGEVFSFTRFHGVTEIYWEGQLVLKDNLLLAPAQMRLGGIGQWEGFTHQAMLIYFNDAGNISYLMEEVHSLLKNEDGVAAGCTAWHEHGLIVRLLGHKAEHLIGLMHAISGLAACAGQHYTNQKREGYAI